MKNIAIIGCGYWGKNLVRNFYKLGVLKVICDIDSNALIKIKSQYPDIILTNDIKDVLKDNTITGVVIATPADSHYELIKLCILHNKNVLAEKPFTTSYSQAEDLVNLSKQKNIILMIGFTFLYNTAVNKVKELIEKEEFGNIYYIYSQRLNLGIIRKDINVWWNLAPHDISIIHYWLNEKPLCVEGTGFSFIQKGIEDVVSAQIHYSSGIGSLVHVSWLDPNKTRKMTIITSKKMIIYDDTSPDMKVQIYDKGIDKFEDFNTFGQFQLIHRAGDIYIPKIDFIEPLEVEAKHFLKCIESNTKPLSSGEWSLPVVKILESVQQSINEKRWIYL